jgi:ribosomal-protein-alanine acetyltransferase
LSIHIRSATAADIAAMMALEKHAATAAHWSTAQHQAVFTTPGPRRLALVIEEGAVMQGFLVARSIRTEWEIENIAIAGPARRRGLGTRLLGEFLDGVRRENAESVFLEVRESNRPARALYERWAFILDGRRKGYYQNPEEDALLYRLHFP